LFYLPWIPRTDEGGEELTAPGQARLMGEATVALAWIPGEYRTRAPGYRVYAGHRRRVAGARQPARWGGSEWRGETLQAVSGAHAPTREVGARPSREGWGWPGGASVRLGKGPVSRVAGIRVRQREGGG
jgi:hypothetical protein